MIPEKRKIQSYERHSILYMHDVLPLIKNVRKAKEQLNGVSVGVSSLRLQTFAAKGTTCVKCGAEASYFAIERDFGKVKSDGAYHLNLWGVDKDGDPLLFTHDHILARALGGKDALENTQTMCCHCNWKKGDAEKILVEERKHEAAKKAERKALTSQPGYSDLGIISDAILGART